MLQVYELKEQKASPTVNPAHIDEAFFIPRDAKCSTYSLKYINQRKKKS